MHSFPTWNGCESSRYKKYNAWKQLYQLQNDRI